MAFALLIVLLAVMLIAAAMLACVGEKERGVTIPVFRSNTG